MKIFLIYSAQFIVHKEFLQFINSNEFKAKYGDLYINVKRIS
jgi:hypothetical protein